MQSLRLTLRIARLLRPHAGGCRGPLWLAGFLALLVLAARLLQPWPVKWVLDALTNEPAPLEGNLLLLSAAYLLISAAAGLTEYFQRMVLIGTSNRIVFRFRRRLFEHLLQQPLAYHEKRGTGELLTRVISDVARLRRGVIGILLRGYQNVFLLLATIAVLLWIHPWLALSILACGALAFLVMVLSNRRIWRASRQSRRKEGKLATVVEENLRGIRDLQTYGPALDPRFETQNEKSLKGEQKVRRLEARLLFRVELLLAMAVGLVLRMGSAQVQSGGMTAGDLVLFLHYALGLYRPFTQFARQASQAGRTMACAERLLKIAERKPAPEGTAAASNLAGSVELDRVRVRAPRGSRKGRKWILRDLSLCLRPGERLAVLGPNGAGKSSLLRLIPRLGDPDHGRLLVDGRDAQEYTLASLRRQVSAMFQEPVLFGMSIRENIAAGDAEASEDRILEAAQRAGVMEMLRRRGRGLGMIIRGGRSLSVGERQRIALARALLRNGRIWVLDEPTTAVDAPADLEQALLAATEGRTTLWATHSIATAMRLDRILLLVDGRVNFFGTPMEFQAWLKAQPPDPYLQSLGRLPDGAPGRAPPATEAAGPSNGGIPPVSNVCPPKGKPGA